MNYWVGGGIDCTASVYAYACVCVCVCVCMCVCVDVWVSGWGGVIMCG